MDREPYRSAALPPPLASDLGVVDEATRLGLLRSIHGALPIWRSVLPVAMVPVSIAAAFWGQCDRTMLAVISAFGLLIFAIVGWGPLRRRGLRLDVHAHGIVVVTPRTREAIVFEDIDELWYELNVHSLAVGKVARIVLVRLVDHAGVEHRVPLAVNDPLTAIQWIVKHCSERLLPDAQAALRAGEALTFGDVRIDQVGITFGEDAAVPWSAIRLARLQPGAVALFKRLPVLPWRTVRLDRIPHPTLFVRLLREVAARVEIDDPSRIRRAKSPGVILDHDC